MKRWSLLLLAAAFLVAPAYGEEIIYFTNGSKMPIRGYAIEEDMIKVDLGDSAFMAFPMNQVERIEKAGEEVFLNPSQANKQFQTKTTSDSFPVRGRAPSRYQEGRKVNVMELKARGATNIGQDKNGIAVYQPFKNGPHAGRARLGAAGHQMVLSGPPAQSKNEGIVGARRVGGKHVITSGDSPTDSKKLGARPVPYQRADLGSLVTKPKPTPAEGEDGTDSTAEAE